MEKTIEQRLAFSTLGCPDWDFATIMEWAKKLGFSALEIRGIGQELMTHKLEMFAPEAQASTASLLQSNGLRICNVGTSVSFHDPQNRQAALDEGMAAIDVCAAMNIPAIRVFGDNIPSGADAAVIIRRVAEGIRALCEYSGTHTAGKVQVWLEVHGDFNTIAVLEPLAAQLSDCALYGMIWDIEHIYRIGEDPALFYRIFKPFIRHTHFKDCRIEDGSPIITLPGEGTLPIASFFNLLEDGGYTGYYSFEWEKRWVPTLPGPETALPRYVSLMRKLFDERV